MTIADNQELYAVVRETIAALQDAHEADLANDLQNALGISSMPGEILGELRLVLLQVRARPIYARRDVQRRVDEGIDYVDRALGSER